LSSDLARCLTRVRNALQSRRGGLADHQIIFTENALTITGISVQSTSFPTLSGFLTSELTFGPSSVDFSLGNLNWSPGDNTVVVQLDFSSGVPEPSTWVMMPLGFAWLGCLSPGKEASCFSCGSLIKAPNRISERQPTEARVDGA
jgi:hypothetical protein